MIYVNAGIGVTAARSGLAVSSFDNCHERTLFDLRFDACNVGLPSWTQKGIQMALHEIGSSLTRFLKATIAGGLLFLLPVILIVIVLGYTMRLAGKVAEPISKFLPVDAVLGVRGVTILAVLVLVVVSLAAGLFARTSAGKRILRWSENSLLGGFPQYRLVKSMAEGLAQVEDTEGVNPALVSIEGGWQIGYLLEPLENGWVAVFLPQAPTPLSGNVMYLPANRVRPLSMTMVQAMAIVKRIGVGSAKALQGADLTLPAGA